MTHSELQGLISVLQLPCIKLSREEEERKFNFHLIGKKLLWDISIYFPDRFPYSLPKAVLRNTDLIGVLPHVNQSGVICLEESDSLFTDYSRPNEVLALYIEDIVKLLDRISLKIYQDELLDELEGYFAPVKKVYSFYHPSKSTETLYMRVSQPEKIKGRKYSSPIMISHKNESLPLRFSNIESLDKCRREKIMHLPLDGAKLPPASGKDFNVKYFISLLELVSKKNWQRALRLAKKYRPYNTFYIFLTMPRTSGERTQFLLKFTSSHHCEHPLLSTSIDWELELYSILRNSKEYLIERGGGDQSFSEKKVAIIGCGSVGSQISNMLGKAGVGELTLIDFDSLSPDNIYRHHLGGGELNYKPDEKSGIVSSFSKVSALKLRIEQSLPYIKVNSIPKKFNEVVSFNNVKNCDVVIVAVGSPSVNLELNNLLKRHNYKYAVFCWSEAAGIGGHAIAVDLHCSCYECLYTKDNQLNAQSDLSLLKVGQPISKNLTGCAGVFTPFSFIDSNRTAELAATLALYILKNNRASIAESWKGDNSADLTVTDKYKKMPLKERISLTRNSECRVCNV